MRVKESIKYEEVVGLKFGYTPFGNPKLFTHVYFVDGLLIDTGPLKMKQSVISSTNLLEVEQMFITHYHEDHTGNIPQLKEIHNCKVYAPKMTCDIMKDPPQLSLIQKIMYGNRGAFDSLIPIDNSINTKNFHFQLIPTPGHAPDMVCLYEPQKKWLFSADLYINSYIGYFLKDESVWEQIESIRHILKLDFKVMFCAHNPQFENSKDKLRNKLNFLESFFYNVEKFYLKGYTIKEIFNALKLKEYNIIKTLSGGNLSKINMVKSVINDIKKTKRYTTKAPM